MTNTQKKEPLTDSAMNSKAGPIQKHSTIIIKNHPEHEGQMYQVKEVDRQGKVTTVENHWFHPDFFDVVSDWQQFNGGFGRFNLTTGELVKEINIKKEFTDRLEASLAPDGWVNFIVLQVDTDLNPHDLRKWLKDNEGTIVERNPNPKDPTDEEWRLLDPQKQLSSHGAQCAEATSALAPLERDRLQYLESLIEASFVVVGRSLKEIRDTRLYRERYANFEHYCKAKWQMGRHLANRQIVASEIYENIKVTIRHLQESVSDGDESSPNKIPMPTKETQLRPIASAKLEPERQATAWQLAVAESKDKVPTEKIVKKVVKEMTQGKPENPWKVGDVCKYVGVTGKSGIWCVVRGVGDYSCTVDDYRESCVQVRPDELKEMEISAEERQFMRDLLPQLQSLSDTDDSMALHTLSFFGKLNRGYLSEKEEAILKVLEN